MPRLFLSFRSPFFAPCVNLTYWTPGRGYWRLVSRRTAWRNAWLENWNHFSIFFPLFLQLLRESEATSMRLTEQAKVLKEEIRRYSAIAAWLNNVFCAFAYIKEFVLQLQNRGFQHSVDAFRVCQYPVCPYIRSMA